MSIHPLLVVAGEKAESVRVRSAHLSGVALMAFSLPLLLVLGLVVLGLLVRDLGCISSGHSERVGGGGRVGLYVLAKVCSSTPCLVCRYPSVKHGRVRLGCVEGDGNQTLRTERGRYDEEPTTIKLCVQQYFDARNHLGKPALPRFRRGFGLRSLVSSGALGRLLRVGGVMMWLQRQV